MSYIIAVAGKGGTGKTTLAALLVRALREADQGPVLAVDADPNANFGELLGVEVSSRVVDVIDSVAKNPDQIPPGITKDRYINMKLQESLDEADGFDLLTMGRPEGPGCYCFANNMLRGLIKTLMNNFPYVVIDNEAGMEHLSRRLVRTIDRFFIVSDASVIGIRSAERISRLADELRIAIKDRIFILNKTRQDVDALKPEIDKSTLELKLILPFSEELEEASVKGRSVFEIARGNPVFSGVKNIVVPHLHAGNVR